MSIDVGRCIEVTVSQPFLYTFKRDTACYKQTCAAMPEIMEPDLIKTMLRQKLRELTAQIIRSYQVAHLINKYISIVIVVITITADALVIFLSFLYSRKVLTELSD